MVSQNNRINGYTLLELTIVLVIIGALISVFVVGKEIRQSAQVTSIVADLTYYQNAKKAFKDKYNYLPGDVPIVPATDFNRIFSSNASDGMNKGVALSTYVCSVTASYLGNGRVDRNSISGAAKKTTEENLFWIELSYTKLIKDSFTYDPCVPGNTATVTVGTHRPESSAMNGLGYTFLGQVTISYGGNSYLWSNVYRIGGTSSDNQLSTALLGSDTVRALDAKLDTDNTPYTGRFFTNASCITASGYTNVANTKCLGNFAETEYGYSANYYIP